MIELISVHVPKTAGNSFMKILKRFYGRDLLRLYHDFRPGVDYERSLAKRRSAKALHGHFPLAPYTEKFPEAKTVVWFRQPVERIISYYYYWLKLRPHGNPNHDAFMSGDRKITTLAELLKDEVKSYLGEKPVEDLSFVGIVEHFEEDMERFEVWFLEAFPKARKRPGPRLGLRMPQANRNRRKGEISQSIKAELSEILQEELALYHEAVRHREAALNR